MNKEKLLAWTKEKIKACMAMREIFTEEKDVWMHTRYGGEISILMEIQLLLEKDES